jgi:aminoglycoside phosphotransferase (APT) family kinase protein
LFYGLAAGFERSGFQVALMDGDVPERAVQSVAQMIAPWSAGVPEARKTVREVRRRLLADAAASAVIEQYGVDWATQFEANEVQTRWCCVHGDLHCGNVLVGEVGQAVVIDYGDVGLGPASLDAVTLELSLLFHPDRVRHTGWPAEPARWGDLGDYLRNCPAGPFVQACRHWARQVAAGNWEIAASAYAYLLRQLKYEDTDKRLVVDLLNGVRRFYFAN